MAQSSAASFFLSKFKRLLLPMHGVIAVMGSVRHPCRIAYPEFILLGYAGSHDH